MWKRIRMRVYAEFLFAVFLAACLFSGCKPSPVGPTSFVAPLGDSSRERDKDYQKRNRETEQWRRDEWERKEERKQRDYAKRGIKYEKKPYVPPGTPVMRPTYPQKTQTAPSAPVQPGRAHPGGASTGARVCPNR